MSVVRVGVGSCDGVDSWLTGILDGMGQCVKQNVFVSHTYHTTALCLLETVAGSIEQNGRTIQGRKAVGSGIWCLAWSPGNIIVPWEESSVNALSEPRSGKSRTLAGRIPDYLPTVNLDYLIPRFPAHLRAVYFSNLDIINVRRGYYKRYVGSGLWQLKYNVRWTPLSLEFWRWSGVARLRNDFYIWIISRVFDHASYASSKRPVICLWCLLHASPPWKCSWQTRRFSLRDLAAPFLLLHIFSLFSPACWSFVYNFASQMMFLIKYIRNWPIQHFLITLLCWGKYKLHLPGMIA
jgi:hypothetical protein